LHFKQEKQEKSVKILALAVQTGEKVLDAVSYFFIAVMFVYGSYSLYSTYRLQHRSFISQELMRYKPSEEGAGFNELMKINSDVIGWLTVDGTNIDLPIVQCSDNTKYVNTDIYGNFSFSGTVFLDMSNSADFSDSYSIIYGHHIDSGAMFGDVALFLSDDFFRGHSTGTLQLPDRTLSIKFFAVCTPDAYDRTVCRNPHGASKKDVLDYIDENAVNRYSTEITEESRLIALYTCNNAMTNGRILLFGTADINS